MSRKRTLGNYFSFRYMITPDIMKIVHVIGLIILNLAMLGGFVVGIYALFSQDLGLDDYTVLILIGGILGSIVVFFWVNIEWRMICEWLILFFSMHEMLSTVEGDLKEVNREVKDRQNEKDDEEDVDVEEEEEDEEED
jgi:Domain of unknown function (DUF4282)